MNWLDIVLLVILAGIGGHRASAKGSHARDHRLCRGNSRPGPGHLVLRYRGRLPAALREFAVASPTSAASPWCFVGVMLLGRAGWSALAGRMLKVSGLSFFDRLLGAAFGFVRGMLVAIAIADGGHGVLAGRTSRPDSVVKSRLAPYVVDAARALRRHGSLRVEGRLPQDVTRKCKAVWEEALKKGIRALPGQAEAKGNEREI